MCTRRAFALKSSRCLHWRNARGFECSDANWQSFPLSTRFQCVAELRLKDSSTRVSGKWMWEISSGFKPAVNMSSGKQDDDCEWEDEQIIWKILRWKKEHKKIPAIIILRTQKRRNYPFLRFKFSLFCTIKSKHIAYERSGGNFLHDVPPFT